MFNSTELRRFRLIFLFLILCGLFFAVGLSKDLILNRFYVDRVLGTAVAGVKSCGSEVRAFCQMEDIRWCAE